MVADILDRAIVARIPVLIKAREDAGRRLVLVEASTEQRDTDGDVVLQKALMDSADSFIATGHLDIDHKSEIGHRMVPPIPDPMSYIVGRPVSVKAESGGRTFVEGEISRSMDGSHNPVRNRYDEFWDTMMRNPPVQWFASIYGFPGQDLMDCRGGTCPGSEATRFIIKSIDWRSLAFTRTPKNTALSSEARVITAKSYLIELAKAGNLEGPPMSDILAVPQTMDDVYARADCLGCRVQHTPSLLGYRMHFNKCLGYSEGAADVMAHAMMHKTNMDRAFKRNIDGVMR
jgi:hypothetical protein